MHERAGKVQLNNDPSGRQIGRTIGKFRKKRIDRLICCNNAIIVKFEITGEREKETYVLAARTNIMVK